MSKSICLNMIVKNESKVIKRCFDSLRDYIDHWIIVDTGSTDGTQKIIKDYWEEYKVPGTLYERPWRNFGHNRTEAIKLAIGKSDYIFLVDADMKMIFEDKEWKNKLDKEAYHLSYVGDYSYGQLKIVKGDLNWEWHGVTHEYISCDNVIKSVHEHPVHETIKIDHIGDGGAKKDKFERDKILLEQGIKDERDPQLQARYHFYLAQTYNCMGKLNKAKKFYEKRTKMGHYYEEIFVSYLQCGLISCSLRLGWNECFKWFFDAFAISSRAEPLYYIANMYALNKAYHVAYVFIRQACDYSYPKDAILYIDKKIYDYGRWSILGWVSFYAAMFVEGDKKKEYLENGIKGCRKAIENARTEDEKKLEEERLKYYITENPK